MKRLMAIAALAMLAAQPAAAQPSYATYAAVRDAMLAVWNEMDLTVPVAELTEGEATGYGQYTARTGNAFRPGETVHVYAEIIGYGIGETASGLYTRSLAADLTLRDADGTVRGSQPNFYASEIVGRNRLLETWLSFTVSLSDFPPGDYVLAYTVRDLEGGKQAQFELPITLTSP